MENYTKDMIEHHGILGQRWGKKNGPPYPLYPDSRSSAEQSKNGDKYTKSGKAAEKAHARAGGGGGGASDDDDEWMNKLRSAWDADANLSFNSINDFKKFLESNSISTKNISAEDLKAMYSKAQNSLNAYKNTKAGKEALKEDKKKGSGSSGGSGGSGKSSSKSSSKSDKEAEKAAKAAEENAKNEAAIKRMFDSVSTPVLSADKNRAIAWKQERNKMAKEFVEKFDSKTGFPSDSKGFVKLLKRFGMYSKDMDSEKISELRFAAERLLDQKLSKSTIAHKEALANMIEHHGILGQKWGKRNGPPYPLNPSDRSSAERSANGDNYTKSAANKYDLPAGGGGGGSDEDDNDKKLREFLAEMLKKNPDFVIPKDKAQLAAMLSKAGINVKELKDDDFRKFYDRSAQIKRASDYLKARESSKSNDNQNAKEPSVGDNIKQLIGSVIRSDPKLDGLWQGKMRHYEDGKLVSEKHMDSPMQSNIRKLAESLGIDVDSLDVSITKKQLDTLSNTLKKTGEAAATAISPSAVSAVKLNNMSTSEKAEVLKNINKTAEEGLNAVSPNSGTALKNAVKTGRYVQKKADASRTGHKYPKEVEKALESYHDSGSDDWKKASSKEYTSNYKELERNVRSGAFKVTDVPVKKYTGLIINGNPNSQFNFNLINDIRNSGASKKLSSADYDKLIQVVKDEKASAGETNPSYDKIINSLKMMRARVEHSLDLETFKMKYQKDVLYHHGILGQKWGRKNGPPYPLERTGKWSAGEKKEGAVKKYLKDQVKKRLNEHEEHRQVRRAEREEERQERRQQVKEERAKQEENRREAEIRNKRISDMTDEELEYMINRVAREKELSNSKNGNTETKQAPQQTPDQQASTNNQSDKQQTPSQAVNEVKKDAKQKVLDSTEYLGNLANKAAPIVRTGTDIVKLIGEINATKGKQAETRGKQIKNDKALVDKAMKDLDFKIKQINSQASSAKANADLVNNQTSFIKNVELFNSTVRKNKASALDRQLESIGEEVFNGYMKDTFRSEKKMDADLARIGEEVFKELGLR